MINGNALRVCVCTSYPADREPRAPRHARAIWETGLISNLTFIDLRPSNQHRVVVKMLDDIPNLNWISLSAPTRDSQLLKWAFDKTHKLLARWVYRRLGIVSNAALTPSLRNLKHLLKSMKPDIIVAHNIDTLLPAYLAAKQTNACLIFDSMEFHSAMGDEQDPALNEIIKSIERRCLKECMLVLTSSSQLADALRATYGVTKLLPLPNVPGIQSCLRTKDQDWMTLYWRNSTIALGQRGLEDAIIALKFSPKKVRLHLQGRHTQEGIEKVMALAKAVGVLDRITIHPPHRPEDAVQEACRFHVGLCLERGGIRNHELTVSNKMYDYHMAGLAVIASDMPSLVDVLKRSNGGLTYRAGDPSDLARLICQIYDDKPLYRQLSANARQFALECGNLQFEMSKLKCVLKDHVFTSFRSRHA